MGKNQDLKRLALQSLVFAIDAVTKEIQYIQEHSDLSDKVDHLSAALLTLSLAYEKIEGRKSK